MPFTLNEIHLLPNHHKLIHFILKDGLTIGREDGSTIRLAKTNTTSRHHAQVTIVPFNTTNSTITTTTSTNTKNSSNERNNQSIFITDLNSKVFYIDSIDYLTLNNVAWYFCQFHQTTHSS